MTVDVSQERGKLWPLLFVLIGVLNIANFFYKSLFQVDDLLQGLGFLLIAPLMYFAPLSLSNPFKPGPHKSQVRPLVRGLGIVGLVLILVGFAVEWL